MPQDVEIRRTARRLIEDASRRNHELKQTVLETRELIADSRRMLDKHRARMEARGLAKDKS